MKILFTGGGTGGHFYPIIAIAEAIEDIEREAKLVEPQLYFAAPDPYDRDQLIAHNITFMPAAAGKMRPYFSLLNAIDYVKTAWGVARSILRIFFLYPDVVCAKGGYASFPTLLAAKIFHIPVVIHESDAVPGRVNRWAGRFAEYIAISFEGAAQYFPHGRVALTGVPVRKAAQYVSAEGAAQFLKLEEGVPILLVLGGSQGATAINDVVLGALPMLVEKYQILHQTGSGNIVEVEGRASIILQQSAHKERYKPYAYLNDLALKMAGGAASLIVSRAGSTIFEIAAWGKPSILVPLPPGIDPTGHAIENALAYARAGACSVLEQQNLLPQVLVAEIARIIEHPDTAAKMSSAAKQFARPDAAKVIAQKLLDIGLSHETD